MEIIAVVVGYMLGVSTFFISNYMNKRINDKEIINPNNEENDVNNELDLILDEWKNGKQENYSENETDFVESEISKDSILDEYINGKKGAK